MGELRCTALEDTSLENTPFEDAQRSGGSAAAAGGADGARRWASPEAQAARVGSSSQGGVRAVRVEEAFEDGRVSVTEVRVLQVTPCAVHGALTTLDLRPVTGRRHQHVRWAPTHGIRRQLPRGGRRRCGSAAAVSSWREFEPDMAGFA